MTRGPAVSVVVATYNGAAHLRQQLASIAAQTLQPAEVVVSDDGSTDGTLAIARDYAASAGFAVEVVENPAPRGPAENFLGAVALATGDLVALCDQDDVWASRKLESCVAPFADPGVTLVVHGSRRVQNDGTPVPEKRLSTGLLAKALRASPLHVPHGSHLLFRRQLADRLPPAGRPQSVYDDPKQTHDEWAHYAAVTFGRAVYLQDRLIDYRMHAEPERHEFDAAEAGAGFENWSLVLDPSRRARAAEARADHLSAVASEASPSDRTRLEGWIGVYRRLAEAQRARVALRASGTPRQAVRGVAAGVRSGVWGRQSGGGAGPFAAYRDLATLARTLRS